MKENITLSGGVISLQKKENDTVVLFLPGMRGAVFSERFSSLEDVVLNNNLSFARLEIWKDGTDLQEKTFTEIQNVLNEAVESLKERGYEKIIAVGKSFGGGLLLSTHNNSISRKILWAPGGICIGSEEEGVRDIKLKDVPTLEHLKVTKEFLQSEPSKVFILHGDADENVPLGNSEALTEANSSFSLNIIPGANHSFREKEMEAILLQETKEALLA